MCFAGCGVSIRVQHAAGRRFKEFGRDPNHYRHETAFLFLSGEDLELALQQVSYEPDTDVPPDRILQWTVLRAVRRRRDVLFAARARLSTPVGEDVRLASTVVGPDHAKLEVRLRPTTRC